jgi:hypothetical protein
MSRPWAPRPVAARAPARLARRAASTGFFPREDGVGEGGGVGVAGPGGVHDVLHGVGLQKLLSFRRDHDGAHGPHLDGQVLEALLPKPRHPLGEGRGPGEGQKLGLVHEEPAHPPEVLEKLPSRRPHRPRAQVGEDGHLPLPGGLEGLHGVAPGRPPHQGVGGENQGVGLVQVAGLEEGGVQIAARPFRAHHGPFPARDHQDEDRARGVLRVFLEVAEVHPHLPHPAQGQLSEGVLAHPAHQKDAVAQAGQLGRQGPPGPPRLHEGPAGGEFLPGFRDALHEEE